MMQKPYAGGAQCFYQYFCYIGCCLCFLPCKYLPCNSCYKMLGGDDCCMLGKKYTYDDELALTAKDGSNLTVSGADAGSYGGNMAMYNSKTGSMDASAAGIGGKARASGIQRTNGGFVQLALGQQR